MSRPTKGWTVKDYWDSFANTGVEIFRFVPEDVWNDYGKLQKWPLQFPWVKVRMQELAYDEQQREFSDRAKNMGFDIEDITYPIRSGVYGNYVGSANYFEASESVIDMFLPDLLKWIW